LSLRFTIRPGEKRRARQKVKARNRNNVFLSWRERGQILASIVLRKATEKKSNANNQENLW
jgi:hypothetical protein